MKRKGTVTNPQGKYLELMKVLRGRFDLVNSLRTLDVDSFSRAETAAFHGRKIVEGIALACLVATEHGLKEVPRSAKGQWNAEKLLKNLKAKNVSVFPSPSIIRQATDIEEQKHNVKSVVEGIPERRITQDVLISIYQSLHRWLHEVNPYVENSHDSFLTKYEEPLWGDLSKLESFLEKHLISISGEAFFCVLRDNQDSATKVIALSKVEEIS